MKKQTVYLLCGTMKDMRVVETKGEVIDLTTNTGFIVKIALLYKRPYYFATHYETGLDCTPYYKPEDVTLCLGKRWRNKDELIERLKLIDFERMTQNEEYISMFTSKIEEYKRNKEMINQ